MAKRDRTKKRRIALIAVATLLGILVSITAVEALTWPDVDDLMKKAPKSTAFIDQYLTASGKRRADWRWVRYDSVAPELKQAVLVSEDINFFSHDGFDVSEIKNALETSLEEGKSMRGASTITQQLAKNLWLSPSRNPFRKLKEAFLTRELEKKLSKERILEIYLNVVELGRGVYGVEAACQRYFDTSAQSVSPRQAAELAAMLPRPRTWYPGVDSTAYREKVERILDRMDKTEWLKERVSRR